MSTILDLSFTALLAQTLQLTIVFAIVLSLDLLVARKGSVGLRAALWTAFFMKLVLPPTLSSPISIARIVENAPESASPSVLLGTALSRSVCEAVVLAVWALGCAASLVCALRSMRASRLEWLAGTRPAPGSARRTLKRLAAASGAKRAPRLCVRDDHAGAASVGLWSPVIVVPAALTLSSSALEHVLLHELGHVRRRDSWRSVAWTIARCVYWFHPLVHIAARRAALVRELACDELAVAQASGGANGYRRTLFDLARPLLRAAPSATAFAGTGSMITTRLERLGRTRPRARRFDALPALAFTLLCVCCVPLGARTAETDRLPSLQDVQGCMRKHYLVLAELAQRRNDGGASATH